MTLVCRKFVPVSGTTGRFVEMQNTTGTQRYTKAVVEIELDGYCYNKEVAVSEQLKEDAPLGTDVILWPHLIEAMEPDEVVQMRKLIGAKEKSYASTT